MNYEIAGEVLQCNHCGHQDFEEGKAQLNTAFMTFINLDFLNKEAQIYTCKKCGKIEWFLPKGEVVSENESDNIECLACGVLIPFGKSTCSECGWSYKN